MTREDMLAMARFWHYRWKDALEAKDFDLAEEYFHRANAWRQRADVFGYVSQEFELRAG